MAEAGEPPLLAELFKFLPEPETLWAVDRRARWLQAVADAFDLIYRGDEPPIIVRAAPTPPPPSASS